MRAVLARLAAEELRCEERAPPVVTDGARRPRLAHCGPPDHRGHGGSPRVDVGPVGSASGDVSVVVPVNDVVEPMPPDVFTAVPVVAMIPPEGFANTPDPVA